MTYEFITTGDEITFTTDSDKVAFACTVMLGKGKAGCKRYENPETIDLDAVVANTSDPNRAIESRLECSLKKFVQDNHKAMAECFHSFAYGTIQQRPQYDKTLEETQGPVAKLKFKIDHENNNRTSLTTWVLGAWELGEAIDKQF